MKSTFGFQSFVGVSIDCVGISQGHFLSAALMPVSPGALWRLALREVAGLRGHLWGSREWAASLGVPRKCVWVVWHWSVIPSWERENEDMLTCSPFLSPPRGSFPHPGRAPLLTSCCLPMLSSVTQDISDSSPMFKQRIRSWSSIRISSRAHSRETSTKAWASGFTF